MPKRREICHGNHESCQLWQQTLTSTPLSLVMVIANGRASRGVDAGFISPTAQRSARPPGVCHREQHVPRRRRCVRSDAAAAPPPPDPAGRRWGTRQSAASRLGSMGGWVQDRLQVEWVDMVSQSPQFAVLDLFPNCGSIIIHSRLCSCTEHGVRGEGSTRPDIPSQFAPQVFRISRQSSWTSPSTTHWEEGRACEQSRRAAMI